MIYLICCILITEILNSSFIDTQDLFGHSWVRLSQFIGTKSSHQVKTYIRSHLHHFGPADENGAQASFSSGSGCCSAGALGFTELIDDMQIPASMEEVCVCFYSYYATQCHALPGKRICHVIIQRNARIFVSI